MKPAASASIWTSSACTRAEGGLGDLPVSRPVTLLALSLQAVIKKADRLIDTDSVHSSCAEPGALYLVYTDRQSCT